MTATAHVSRSRHQRLETHTDPLHEHLHTVVASLEPLVCWSTRRESQDVVRRAARTLATTLSRYGLRVSVVPAAGEDLHRAAALLFGYSGMTVNIGPSSLASSG